MEGELYNAIQKPSEHASTIGTHEVSPLPELSFIPPELLKKEETKSGWVRNKCALVGVVLGALALVSWVVILFGVIFSVAGVAFSITGLKSNYPKYARAGLILSVLGFIASVWYVFAAHQGMINYNYFTSEFWEATSGIEKGAK